MGRTRGTPRPRLSRGRGRRAFGRRAFALAAVVATLGSLASGCGDTLQIKPIPHNILESLIVAPFPVYWLGERFKGMQITEATEDASGSFTVQYGNCLQGGQGTCTPPLRLVTSPDNSFVPGGATPSRAVTVRGVPALLADSGHAIVIATGGVVLDIFAAEDPRLARAAARAAAPINRPESPGEALPARLPDTGYGSTPLPKQLPATVRPLG